VVSGRGAVHPTGRLPAVLERERARAV
jgi:hypothetical protein